MAKDVVLITGASGFIGSALIRKLANKYTLVGLDRAGPRLLPRRHIRLNSTLAMTDQCAQHLSRFGRSLAAV